MYRKSKSMFGKLLLLLLTLCCADTIGATSTTLWKMDAPFARTAVCTSEYARAATLLIRE